MIDPGPLSPPQDLPAGFWRRVAAWIIDTLILTAAVFLVGAFVWPDLIETTTLISEVDGVRLESMDYSLSLRGTLVLAVAYWAYSALQESGRAQATLGKRALGIRVTDLDGARVSLLTATYRNWPQWLPHLVGAVFILDIIAGVAALAACLAVPFTRRKQGLHDMMARCLVVRRLRPGL